MNNLLGAVAHGHPEPPLTPVLRLIEHPPPVQRKLPHEARHTTLSPRHMERDMWLNVTEIDKCVGIVQNIAYIDENTIKIIAGKRTIETDATFKVKRGTNTRSKVFMVCTSQLTDFLRCNSML